MNSLNLLSHIGNTPPPSPQRSRRASEVNLLQPQLRPTPTEEPNDAGARSITSSHDQGNMGIVRAEVATYSAPDAPASEFGEKAPLLSRPSEGGYADAQTSKAWLIPRRIAEAAIGTVRVLFTAVLAPGRYVIACFYEEDGQFSILTPLYKVSRAFTPKRRKAATMPPKHASDSADSNEKERRKSRRLSVTQTKTKKPLKRSPSVASTSTAMTSDSEMDSERPPTRDEEKPSHHTRTRSTALNTTEEIAPAKRSIRIKLHNEEALRQRRARKSTSRTDSAKEGTNRVSPEAAAALKSPSGGPTSLSAAKQLTRFPRAPQPPRPLVPRRQPSYSTSGTSAVGPHQKTLILDLDETLIHSMTKSTRYSSGHMIEVKLQTPVGAGGQIIGPQVPILYFVHERPHCYDFLKKVSKWYNLIIFTASVQEYADPVIDLIEKERKYFAGRYYRQHCTFRNGAYIKDLAQVEPDLSKVMIVDNSPMSYVFHEDNAIPIEGWVNDPTDTCLLHLIPLLEGLQYVTDVRALLALRLGQPPSV